MSKKSGQAHVPNEEERKYLFEQIKLHRHPEKNTAIMQLSFKLGLRVQEIALLQIKEICRLHPGTTAPRSFEIYKVLSLPASYTKGSNALRKSSAKKIERKSVRFTTDEFEKTVIDIVEKTKNNLSVCASDYYPEIKKRKGKSRDLPLIDSDLRDALLDYLRVRLDANPTAKPSSPLFLNQKGNPYSPNTLQEHMALMLRGWAGIEKATSHSGRRALITDIIHKQKRSIKVAQKIAGHSSAATTTIYTEPPEEEISNALEDAFK